MKKSSINLSENEYIIFSNFIYDLLHPIWKSIIINGVDTGYKVSNSGKVLNPSNKILGSYRTNGWYIPISLYVNGQRLKDTTIPLSKYSIDKVTKVCEMLEDPSISISKISNVTNMGISTVYNILRGKRYKDISIKFNFNKRK